MQGNLKLLAREIVFAEFEPDRKFVQGIGYMASGGAGVTTPKKYLAMSKRVRRLERMAFWFQLIIFSAYIAAVCFLPASTADINPVVLALILLIAVGALYRVLVSQAYLRWMYAHK